MESFAETHGEHQACGANRNHGDVSCIAFGLEGVGGGGEEPTDCGSGAYLDLRVANRNHGNVFERLALLQLAPFPLHMLVCVACPRSKWMSMVVNGCDVLSVLIAAVLLLPSPRPHRAPVLYPRSCCLKVQSSHNQPINEPTNWYTDVLGVVE